jgi:SAM-dependent methyltransferase
MFAEIKWMLRYQIAALRRCNATWRKDVSSWGRFWRSYKEYNRLTSRAMQPRLDRLYPCLGDDTGETLIEPIYFYQDVWAFERIVQRRPSAHVDVGSHHKFVALLSKVVPVTMVDIRPLSLPLESLLFRQGSILDLPFEDGSVSSLSSLCVVEHIGLGRYGDPLDPQGTEKAIAELKRVLAPGGNLWLSMPVSDENVIHFNAGRIFSIEYVLRLIEPLQVVEQAYIVGRSLQSHYEHRPWFATTALFELKMPQ